MQFWLDHRSDHANIRTTQIYAHVTNPVIRNIKGPF